jgi:hypothetical protein
MFIAIGQFIKSNLKIKQWEKARQVNYSPLDQEKYIRVCILGGGGVGKR